MQGNEDIQNFDGSYVDTVLGPIEKYRVGVTLTHEHLLGDFSKFYKKSLEDVNLHRQYEFTYPFLNDFGYVHQYPYSHPNNLQLNDVQDVIINEVTIFKQTGGKTIVEKSSRLNRNIGFLKLLSERTKVNIIIGTGYHIADTENLLTCTTTTKEMYDSMNNEFINGCQNYPDIRPAFIADSGNILLDFEKRALRAIGELQGQYRYPVSFHPQEHVCPLDEVMRIYEEAGGRPTEFVMCHIDRLFRTKEDLMEFVDEHKCYIQFDQFGVMSSFYQLNPIVDVLSDTQSIRLIALLNADNKLHRVLISHDIHTKHRLLTFGGLGFSHISETIVPLMLQRNLSWEDVNMMRVINPFKWLRRLGDPILI